MLVLDTAQAATDPLCAEAARLAAAARRRLHERLAPPEHLLLPVPLDLPAVARANTGSPDLLAGVAGAPSPRVRARLRGRLAEPRTVLIATGLDAIPTPQRRPGTLTPPGPRTRIERALAQLLESRGGGPQLILALRGTEDARSWDARPPPLAGLPRLGPVP